jgi:serine/threonine protein kinase
MPELEPDDINHALGPFDHVERIGDPSGSGECYRVEHGGDVRAIKAVVRGSDPERFRREVAALERVDHDRIVHIYDHGVLTARDGRQFPYITSEFIPGGDVDHVLDDRGEPDDDELRAFLAGCLEGLEAIHAANIVHRDFKPANVMLRDGRWDQPVIIDLGLIRLLDASTHTVYPWAGGTWPWMAPEQFRGERATDRSDMWALAVVAAEVAANQHPFWQGEPSPPADWQRRLQPGPDVPARRPAGLRDWVRAVGQFRGYRRPTATRARELLETAWPQ